VTAESCPACTGRFSSPAQKIAELGTSVLYLGDDQFFPGWCILLLKRHATELWQLAPAERATLMDEVTRVAQALAVTFDAVKMNYELLGNQVAHIHWHLVPRRADDPSPRMPAWTVGHEPRRLSAAETAERVARIRAQLGA
jgi:diadenosine tetraphosphate (Ap4A) HIT family hydrolase